MMPYKYDTEYHWFSITGNEREAISHFYRYFGNLTFRKADPSYQYFSENEFLFSYAIAKYQEIVRFE